MMREIVSKYPRDIQWTRPVLEEIKNNLLFKLFGILIKIALDNSK